MRPEGNRFPEICKVRVPGEELPAPPQGHCAKQNSHHGRGDSFRPERIAVFRRGFVIFDRRNFVGERAQGFPQFLKLFGRPDTAQQFLSHQSGEVCSPFINQPGQFANRSDFFCIQAIVAAPQR